MDGVMGMNVRYYGLLVSKGSLLSLYLDGGVWLDSLRVTSEVLFCFCISMRCIAVASNDVYDNVICLA